MRKYGNFPTVFPLKRPVFFLIFNSKVTLTYLHKSVLDAVIIRNVGIIQGRVFFEEFTCMISYYYSIDIT